MMCTQVGEEESGLSIERQVTAVLTPGTLVDCAMLEESYNNFLVAVMPPSVESGTWGLAFSDISTGMTYILLQDVQALAYLYPE